MLNESGRHTEPVIEKMLVSPDELVPGMKTAGLHGISTPIEIIRASNGSNKVRIRHEGGRASQDNKFADGILMNANRPEYKEVFDRYTDQVIVDLGAGISPNVYMNLLRFKPRGYIAVEAYNAPQLLKNFATLGKKKEDFIELCRPIPDLFKVFEEQHRLRRVEEIKSLLTQELTPERREELEQEKELLEDAENQYKMSRESLPLEEQITDFDAYGYAERFEALQKEGMNDAVPFAIAQEDMLTFLRRLPDDSVSLFISGIDDDILGLYADEHEEKNRDYLRNVNAECYRVLNQRGIFIKHVPPILDAPIKAHDAVTGKFLDWKKIHEHDQMEFTYK